MVELFNPENRFWNFVGKLADVTMISILWLVTSLPVITVGASTAAFYDFTLKAVRDQESSVFRGYFGAWKRHFRKATLLWLVQLAVIGFFAMDLWFSFLFWTSGHSGLILIAFLTVLLDLFLCTAMYSYGILVVFDHPVSKIFRDAPLMAMRCLPATALMMLLPAAFAVLFYQLSGFFFFWVGAVILASSYLMNMVFLRVAE